MKNEITIFGVDDHQLILAGLKEIVQENDRLRWLGSANSGKELLENLKVVCPHILLLDLNMPGQDGFDLIPILKEKYPEIKILVISMYDDNNIIKKVLQLGVDGFVPKNANPEELNGALLNIANGQKYFSPHLMESLLHQNSKNEQANSFSKLAILTKREIEIVKLIVNGMSNQEIAEELFISKRTVDNHRSNIMQKLDLSSVVDLVKLALKENLVS